MINMKQYLYKLFSFIKKSPNPDRVHNFWRPVYATIKQQQYYIAICNHRPSPVCKQFLSQGKPLIFYTW